jgi:glutathionylspermidine synthase
LTGIISSTKSFQNAKATPKSFAAAAKLMAAGADQQLVINNLFKNKSLSTLKLWGRTLARVKHNPEKRIAWSLISRKDFASSGADEANLEGITNEIMTSVSGTETVLVLFEMLSSNQRDSRDILEGTPQNNIGIIIKTFKEANSARLAEAFNVPAKDGVIKLKIGNKNLVEAEKKVLEKVKGIL